MVKNLAAYKTRVFFRKACLMFMAFIKKAVYYGRESTPQTSVTDEHSSCPAMRQVTTATLIRAAKHHAEINFFCLTISRVYFVLDVLGCHFLGPSLAGQVRSVHHLVMFICHKNCPQTPSSPPRQAFLWPALQLSAFLFFTVHMGIEPIAGLSVLPGGARASGFQGGTGKEGAALWEALSWIQEHLG